MTDCNHAAAEYRFNDKGLLVLYCPTCDREYTARVADTQGGNVSVAILEEH